MLAVIVEIGWQKQSSYILLFIQIVQIIKSIFWDDPSFRVSLTIGAYVIAYTVRYKFNLTYSHKTIKILRFFSSSRDD